MRAVVPLRFVLVSCSGSRWSGAGSFSAAGSVRHPHHPPHKPKHTTQKHTHLQNVSTCYYLNTLCNNNPGAKNYAEQVLQLTRKLGLLRPRDLKSIGVPRVYLKQLLERG